MPHDCASDRTGRRRPSARGRGRAYARGLAARQRGLLNGTAMRSLFRLLVAFVCAVATYYFTYWFGGALLGIAGLPAWTAFVVAVLATVLVVRYVWRQTQTLHAGLATSVLLGALVTGAVAFSIGFFSPMIFTPGANQGPLLGIFITGPLGVIVGAVGGALYWSVRKRRGVATDDEPAA